MDSVNISILSQELEPLNTQIALIQGKIKELEANVSSTQAALESFSTNNQRFEALRDVCNALDTLAELEATELFWDGVPGNTDAAEHIERLRNRIVQFERDIQSFHDKQNSLKVQINQCHEELDGLYRDVHDAYARDERRKEAFILEREISPIPYRAIIMPWSSEGESENRFRRALLIAMLLTFFFGTVVPLVKLPVPDPTALVKVPERLAMLLKKEPLKPEPIPERPKEKKKPTADEEKPTELQDKTQSAEATAKKKSARKKAESTGVLAFKSSFTDLMDETPVARLGAQARFSKNSPSAAGKARGSRSMVAMAGGSGGGSGGIRNSDISRNVGSGGTGDKIGGVGFARIASSLTGMEEEGGRALSDGPGPARTDEEIQIVFDRYKALLYRIYNKELRKNPTLRGKILLRITIEPSGTVSKCTVESTNLGSPELVALIVARVKKFNFGPKDNVPKTTILYPIDFLPAG